MEIIEITLTDNEERIVPYIFLNENKEVTIKATLRGDNSSLLLIGIFLGEKDFAVTFNTEVVHIGKNTKSLTTMRAVFKDKAVFSNDGLIKIEKGAKNTDAYFQSKVLLFDDAKGKSVPSLEILENEVKAGHGSTLGRPDIHQLFYLQSRGLSEKQAEALLVSGFFEPIVKLLPQEQQKAVSKKIAALL